MYCDKCGSALPSHGFICPKCGAMMNSEQIKRQKEFMKNQKQDITFMSDNYRKEPLNRNYQKNKENKFLGAIIIIVIILVIVTIALIKLFN